MLIFLINLCVLIKHYDWRSKFHHVIQFCHNLKRCIDTAMRAIRLVNVPSKLFTPRSIMNTNMAIHRHPVFHWCCIVGAPEHPVLLFKIHKTNLFWCIPSPRRIPSDDRRVDHDLAIYILIHMLIAHIHFYIGIPNIV